MCLCKVILTLQTQKPTSPLKMADEAAFDTEFDNLDPTKVHLKRQKDHNEITEFYNDKSRYLTY